MDLIWARDAYALWEDTARYIEPLLQNKSVEYRSIPLSKHNKLIYFVTDKINIIDIWDTRREPKSLVNKIQ